LFHFEPLKKIKQKKRAFSHYALIRGIDQETRIEMHKGKRPKRGVAFTAVLNTKIWSIF